MKISQYLKYFILFNILVALPPGYMQLSQGGKNVLIPYFWQLFTAFASLNLITFLLIYWKLPNNSEGSVMALMGSVAIKLLLWMIVVFIYIQNIKVGATNFILDFFYLYLLNSVFEIYCLLRNLRNQNLR